MAEDTPHYNITQTDLTHLTTSIRSTLSGDVHQHVEEHMDKVHNCYTYMYMYIHV